MGVRILGWARNPALLPRLALASVIVNVVIVVTGGAVRLTGSGLGCPTWPSCTDDSLTPTKSYALHGIIEFTNRQLTFVLSIVVLATLVAALLVRRERALAVLLAASIPAQAVLGGITVLTKLNPWSVAAHFMLSIAIIAVAFVLWWRLRAVAAEPAAPGALRGAGWVMLAITAAVLAVGTVVTGSGPHAGDKGATHRIHLAPASVAQLHADLVMLLIGVTIGFVLLARATGASGELQRAGYWLLGIELGQGLIGFVQYFTHVPALLVGIHMFGACLVWLAALTVLGRLGVGIGRPRSAAGLASDEAGSGVGVDAPREPHGIALIQ
ncbi:MAG: COX15/CtaA family protein [Actinomycetota bacterium]|nr:COX15/CtaA family protein [Actinomycetota bacterium]MDQ2956266.1 COX15/CtaA family protein [Actinomycetota bacterium]